jgi:RecB family endonuclease NucS
MAEIAEGTIFKLEREMQAAVRKQLSMLESGLSEADGGQEVAVATGRIDILARDQDGKLVVIELKAGACPPGALEQTLGYAEALAEERGEPVRAYLVAAEFSDRIRAAAKRVSDLQLRTYEFSLRFFPLS